MKRIVVNGEQRVVRRFALWPTSVWLDGRNATAVLWLEWYWERRRWSGAMNHWITEERGLTREDVDG